MADVAQGERNLLTSKVGKVPVWVIGLGGLIAAWIYAKWRDTKNAAKAAQSDTTASMGDTSESQQVAPQFIIENNMPPDVGAPSTPSAPVTPPANGGPITPPGKVPNPPVSTLPAPVKKPPPKPPAKGKEPVEYKVKHGDTLSSIAARYHTTWQKLFAYNTTPGVRPASTIATLKKRGPNLLYANETILIPPK